MVFYLYGGKIGIFGGDYGGGLGRKFKNHTYTPKLECIVQFYHIYKGVMGKGAN